MLQSVRIKNLALLEEVSLDFGGGFTAVTGETGAGKSILLGALSLLAGERADKSVIRQGAPASEVEAALFFQNPERINALLAELDLPACEDGLLILKRSVPREKAPKVTVNGSLATLGALQRLGELWIDFHGPSEPRRLLKESCQLELLDLFGHHTEALGGYQTEYRAWRALLTRREQIAGEEKLSADQIRYLEAQLEKLDALDLAEEAIDRLERDFQRQSQAQELIGIAEGLANGLAGEDGLTGRLAALVRDSRTLESLDPSTKAFADRLASTAIELADLGEEFSRLTGEYQVDPEQVEALQEKMATWLDAKRRHGGERRAVVEAREAMRARLAMQGDLEGALAKLDAEIATAAKAVMRTAQVLRAAREKSARELAKVAAKAIGQLGFKRAEFQVRIVSLPQPGPMGDCGAEFVFSPNVGEAPLPLNRVASSGELARVMLALKTVLADLDEVPVLVFDEVDANVGGEIGRVVGEKMAEISRQHQVVCVTHLPQVAAQGAQHLVVTKDQSGERATVVIAPIHEDRSARLSELARMLGDRTAKSALAHAGELLKLGV
jgi:DNA repair protein RecN (Recombination protein N)